jgi:hypothetical protein
VLIFGTSKTLKLKGGTIVPTLQHKCGCKPICFSPENHENHVNCKSSRYSGRTIALSDYVGKYFNFIIRSCKWVHFNRHWLFHMLVDWVRRALAPHLKNWSETSARNEVITKTNRRYASRKSDSLWHTIEFCPITFYCYVNFATKLLLANLLNPG